MPRTTHRYFFGRLNVIGTYSDKTRFLLDGLTKPTILKRGDNVWGFFDVQPFQDALGDLVGGYLVKFRPEIGQEVVDLGNHRIVQGTIANATVAKSRFFLHVHSGLIAYHLVPGHIEQVAFRKWFSEVFAEAHGAMFVSAEIDTVGESTRILDEIRRFSAVSRISIYLHPANPSVAPVWRPVHERLQRLNTDLREDYTVRRRQGKRKNGSGGPPKGIDIAEDADLTAKITMAHDGYGKAKVTGTVDGAERTVSTERIPLSAMAPSGDVPQVSVMQSLRGMFQRILERFAHDGTQGGHEDER